MTVLDDVRALITRLTPSPICDDCIAEKLGLSGRQHANRVVHELVGADRVSRGKDVCSMCGGDKMVTRRS